MREEGDKSLRTTKETRRIRLGRGDSSGTNDSWLRERAWDNKEEW